MLSVGDGMLPPPPAAISAIANNRQVLYRTNTYRYCVLGVCDMTLDYLSTG